MSDRVAPQVSLEAAAETAPIAVAGTRSHSLTPAGWWRNPWRKPRVLSTVTWAYIAWSLLPVLVAIALSFNAGRSNTTLQTLGLRWWFNDPDGESLFQDPVLRGAIAQTLKLSVITMLIAVPLGVAFAIGIDRWRGRPARGANFLMLVTFVMPEIMIGAAMLWVITFVFSHVGLHLGTGAQIVGLSTYQIAYPVIIVRARLLSIGKEYEEAGMDLGASPRQSIRAVLLPLLYPAIFVSFAIVFADTVDDFVTVSYLLGPASSTPLSMFVYTSARASATPATNAAATLMMVSATVAIGIGYVLYKRFSRGQTGADAQSFTQL